jgi:hypothetical protein
VAARIVIRMSSPPPTQRTERPDAAAANDAIRALVDTQTGGEWPAEEYERLLAAWAAAVKAGLSPVG